MNRINKVLVFALCCVMLLSGCTLALPESGEEQSVDKLIGVVVTFERDDDFIFRNQDIENEVYAKKQECYEDGIKSEEYVFEDVDGMTLYLVTIDPEDEENQAYRRAVCGDDRMCEVSTGINTGDDGHESNSIKGKIYLDSESMSKIGADIYVNLNPVYQKADGQVYMKYNKSGFCIWSNADKVPGTLSLSLNESTSLDVKGEKSKYSFEATVEFECITLPDTITVYEMDENNAVVSSTDYKPEDMPEELVTHSEWLLVESVSADGSVSRQAYSRNESEEDADEYINTYTAGKDGLCILHGAKIVWAEKNDISE